MPSPACPVCLTPWPPEAETCPACGHEAELDHDDDLLPDGRDEAFDYAETLRRERLEVRPPHWGWFLLAGLAVLLTLILLAS
ncbi:MAG: hypothetical protein KDD82_01880 [Planctomycetes bacterium]|nr:hypothetical protein [Planctomycetota bacterium]